MCEPVMGISSGVYRERGRLKDEYIVDDECGWGWKVNGKYDNCLTMEKHEKNPSYWIIETR